MAEPKYARRTHSDRFPLTLHKTGQYCKKIRGKLHYVGTDDGNPAISPFAYPFAPDGPQATLPLHCPPPIQSTPATPCVMLLPIDAS